MIRIIEKKEDRKRDNLQRGSESSTGFWKDETDKEINLKITQ